MKLSQKQVNLIKKIRAKNTPKISILGSVQSGKTFSIALGTILYSEDLSNEYPNETFDGAIIGWSVSTMKKNILEVILNFFKMQGTPLKENKDWKWGQNEKWLKLHNITFTFFSFNNVLSFNNILGRPLLYVWVDESARIYSQNTLQENFDQLPGRQSSFSGHPFKKTIHSFNVEGNSRHPYKQKYLDNTDAIKFTFYPYDNPKIDTKEKYDEFVKTYPEGSLREQKIFNHWVVAEGKVFNDINVINNLDGLIIMQIGIGVDYGNVNPTTFVPIALCYDQIEQRYKVVRLGIYYHNSGEDENKPTTAWYVEQEKSFINYLMKEYPNIPITDNVVDSEAIHFTNALYNAGVDYTLATKGSGSVDRGVQQLQSLFYKKVLYVLNEKSINKFVNNIPQFDLEDIGQIELASYQYDNQKSVTSGQNCYVKDMDHSIDSLRYIVDEWQRQSKILVI